MTKEGQPIILITGGAGYVGSHSILLLLQQNYRVVVVDNCVAVPMHREKFDSNGNVQEMPESLHRVEQLAGKKLTHFEKLDLTRDQDRLNEIFNQYTVKAVIHYAALKSVSESINSPLEYYTNNLVGTINLLNVMKLHGCRRLIFSSSATVYGLPQYLPVDENHQVGLNILNPYGRTKHMIELILKDLTKIKPTGESGNSPGWSIIALRYFNPVGAHPSGYLGEHTQGIPNNLMPYVSQVSIGKRERLYVFGDDFNTIDGTGVRDYIHIMDLASGHTYALDYMLREQQQNTYKVFNLGTGKGYSVLEVIRTFEDINGVKVPYQVTARREGDAGEVYADASLALRELGWRSKYSLVEMVRDTYKWQKSHPDGFKSSPSGIIRSRFASESEIMQPKSDKKSNGTNNKYQEINEESSQVIHRL